MMAIYHLDMYPVNYEYSKKVYRTLEFLNIDITSPTIISGVILVIVLISIYIFNKGGK